MARPRKWTTDTERREAQNQRRKAERAAGKSQPYVARHTRFTGVDGEGSTRGRDHRYVLLGVGGRQVSRETGLQFPEICEFLWDCYLRDRGSVFAGYFLGYDFAQWFRTLPEDRGRMLFHPELRARRPLVTVSRETGEKTEEPNPLGPFPVQYAGWEFDVLGMRRFKLRRQGVSGWMYVCDAGPFFQASFLSTIDPQKWNEPIVTDDEYQIIKEGKERRDTAVLDSDMRYYNELENEVFARLMARLDTGLRNAGVRLAKDQWFGPGQAAGEWLRKERVPDGKMVRKALPSLGANGDILHKGRMTYYGGWFEIFAHGHIPGTTWEYDINSAYPYIASTLPCLLHGTWQRSDRDIDRTAGGIRIVHARIHGSNAVCGTMLHRRKNHSIVRPHGTEGWYWEHEIAAGMRAGVIDTVEVFQGVEYSACDCPYPLGALSGLYAERLRVGKDSAEGKAAKLLYNSVYGKFAQSVGNPRYGNALYASLITAGCRTMILDAIASHPEGTDGLVMVATDGIYFRSQHPQLLVGGNMGEWECKPKNNLTLFKPGIYWDDDVRQRIRDGEDPHFKSRGISAKAFAGSIADIDRQFHGWDDDGTELSYPSVTFTSSFSMVTPLQALQRGKWKLAGTLGHEANEDCEGCTGIHLVQDSDPIQKRKGLYKAGDIWRSGVWEDGGFPFASTPYDRAFGQPDPDEYGITDDGTVKDGWRIHD